MRFGFASAGLFFFLATMAAVFTGEDAGSTAQADEKPATAEGKAAANEGVAKGESAEKPDSTAEKSAVAEKGESGTQVAANESGHRAPASASTANIEESSFGNAVQSRLPDAAQVDDIRKQRDLLDAKQKELATREAELAARERALDEEIKKLKVAREDLTQVDGAHQKESEEKVAKVVETLETMSPKASSALLGSLDEKLAVSAMARIATPKLAKIMNLMEPAKSSRLTELLAGVVAGPKSRVPASSRKSGSGRNTASNDADTATTAEAPMAAASTKGGKNLNGNQEQLSANSNGPDSKLDASVGAPEKGKNPR